MNIKFFNPLIHQLMIIIIINELIFYISIILFLLNQISILFFGNSDVYMINSIFNKIKVILP